jgi:hypothetical protein
VVSSNSSFGDEFREFLGGKPKPETVMSFLATKAGKKKQDVQLLGLNVDDPEDAFIQMANVLIKAGKSNADVVEGLCMALVQSAIVSSGARQTDGKELREKVRPHTEAAFEAIGEAMLKMVHAIQPLFAEAHGDTPDPDILNDDDDDTDNEDGE